MSSMENSEIIKALEANSKTPNYNKWIFDNLKNFLGESILEIGSGIGNITTYISENTGSQLVLTEILDEFLAVLKKRYGSRNNIKIFKCDVLDKEFVELVSKFDIDTVLCINVLEHLEDDLKALCQIKRIIKKEGHIVILVPAFNFLYSRWDSVIGHYKRYNKERLVRLLSLAGFRIKKVYYMNFMGFFAWFFSAKILNLSPASANSIVSKQAIFFDRYAVNPSSVIEGIVHPPFGLSVFAVGTPE